MRWSWSTSSVPAALAAMAKMPNGVSRTMKRATRAMAVLAVRSTSSSGCLCSTPIRASPVITENSTTAGTTLLASEWNGLAGT